MVYLPSRKAAERLGLHPNTLRTYADQGKIPHYRNSAGQRLYDVDAYLRGSIPAETVCYCRVSSARQRDDLQRQVDFMRERYPDARIVTDVGGGLNFHRKGLVALLERLHRGAKLRIVVAHRDRLARFGFDLIQWMAEQNGGGDRGSRQHETTAPKGNSPKIFSPCSRPSVAGCTDSAGTKTQSRRIRIYPTPEQKKLLRLWFDAARWNYNETIAWLQETQEKAVWKALKTPIIHSAPERLKVAPYQVRSIAVRDACRAMSMVKKRNKGRSKTDGLAKCSFRSRKHPKQSCFIPSSAVSAHGAYHSLLGRLRMAESLPAQHGDSRLTLHNGQYHLVVTYPAQQQQAETQGRVVALDPGIRSFLTYFSESATGHIGKNDFGRIQRLCAHLDNLLSKAKRARQRLQKRNLYAASNRIRIKIINLVDELHHQAARWLVDNYDLILIPSFETKEMSGKSKRKLRAKSVRMLLTFAHFRFRQFLIWKAWQSGKQVLVVNEAYTSKTCSWSGEIIANLGGRKVVRGSDGVALERDINGARGIFLRALGDSPVLRKLTQDASATNTVSVC